MSLELPASRPLRSAYEREVQQQGAAQLLASPSLLAAWAAQRGISVARAELQLLQARRSMLGSRWQPLRRCVRHVQQAHFSQVAACELCPLHPPC